MRIRVITVLVLVGLAFVMAGERSALSMDEKRTAPSREETAQTRAEGRYLATIAMDNGGKIEIVLEGADMPYTTTNFVKLAKSGFYDGLTFHRVVPNFVIQGGCPQGNGMGGPGYKVNLEISPFLRHKRGAISMARSQHPDSAGSQFFICTNDTSHLDAQYAVFGWVKSGMDVVDAVKQGDTMKSVAVEPYEGAEECPILAK